MTKLMSSSTNNIMLLFKTTQYVNEMYTKNFNTLGVLEEEGLLE
jgi:hypothetical protein